MDREDEEEELTVKAAPKEADVFTSVCCLGYLSSINLLVAVCVGMYVRWEVTSEPMILVIFILGLFVLAIACILHYYFAMEKASLSLFHLWFGFLLGLLCFLNSPALDSNITELVANYLLVASVVMKAVWAVTERICRSIRYKPMLLSSSEWLELLGFGIASTTMLLSKSAAIVGLVVALGALVVDLRMKSLLALPNLICFALVTSLVFFQALDILANPYALGCFLGRQLCEPVLDVYFSGLGPSERWMPVLSLGKVWRRLSLFPLCLMEVTFFVFAAFQLGHLELWYLVIPGFCLFGLFWAICHVILLITIWGFHTKLTDCQKAWRAHPSSRRSLDQVMASRGIRHFCLISERLVFFSLLSTVILGAVSWQLSEPVYLDASRLCLNKSDCLFGFPQSSNGLFLSALLVVLPLESLTHGLFQDLGSCLGGTCAGYALVIPTIYSSASGQPTPLLPPEHVQELNQRSTTMLNNIQRLFTHHMIQSFGCDYSTSGVTLETVQNKLRSFLELRTADGPRHDTYLIFYSGHSQKGTGAWTLAGGESLHLSQLLDMWKEKNAGHGSRLIVVLDTENSHPWVKDVRRAEGVYMAVQGAELPPSRLDPEFGDVPLLGDFTSEWVEFNCDPTGDAQWAEKGRSVTATYGVSKHWSDYMLHLPTGSDVAKHWKTHFPKATYPMIHLSNWCCGLNLFWLCNVFLRCFRRCKMAWFPPAVLDTGQGIKLVHS